MDNTIEIKGTIKLIKETQTFGSGFTKREFVVTTLDDKYPQDLKMEVVKDKCDELDKFGEGDLVTAAINLRGNEYNGSYYINLHCWKLVSDGVRQHHPAQEQPQLTPADNMDDDDCIPF